MQDTQFGQGDLADTTQRGEIAIESYFNLAKKYGYSPHYLLRIC